MKTGYSFGNILRNMTKKQKVGAVVFLVIIVVLALVLILLVMSGQQAADETTGDDGGNTGQSDVASVKEESYVDDEGYTVTKEITTYTDGSTSVNETKMDDYGNVTTVNPELITSYFPYQVMRKHTSEDLVESGYDYTLRYSLGLDEEARTIMATIEYCDIETDKALVQQYIDSIPLDLSAYTVNYETFSEDAICDE